MSEASSPLYYAWTDTLKYVYYGPGSVKSALPKLLNALKASRALVVTGKTLHDKVTFREHIRGRYLNEKLRLMSFGKSKLFSGSPMHTVQHSMKLDSMPP